MMFLELPVAMLEPVEGEVDVIDLTEDSPDTFLKSVNVFKINSVDQMDVDRCVVNMENEMLLVMLPYEKVMAMLKSLSVMKMFTFKGYSN
jgi:hypothetical protein